MQFLLDIITNCCWRILFIIKYQCYNVSSSGIIIIITFRHGRLVQVGVNNGVILLLSALALLLLLLLALVQLHHRHHGHALLDEGGDGDDDSDAVVKVHL